jgi:two-component sensor histidine kinase
MEETPPTVMEEGTLPKNSASYEAVSLSAVTVPVTLIRRHADLSSDQIAHLQRLLAGWGMLSDLCFGDLLLLVPVRGLLERFIVVGQVRPTTNRTLHRSDLVGTVIDASARDLPVRAWKLGQIVDGEFEVEESGERARIECIPVRHKGILIAILSRESPLDVGRKWGELERVYVELFERFARMILEGTYPFPEDEPYTDYAPRVGDGLMVLDRGGHVTYASPNAVNAMHRAGVIGNVHGARIDELIPEASGVLDVFLVSRPVVEEVERPGGLTIVFRCIPLLDGCVPSGAVLLLRDVSDLRHRDRLLLSKEATIREVHHRVKNNLQTISSLLRLQARRLGGESDYKGRAALREAERRIRSIAVVHEILAQEAGDQVPFGEAVEILVSLVKESFPDSGELDVVVTGDAGSIPAEVATPLALVVAELLQNAVEHAFAEVPSTHHRVEVRLSAAGRHVSVEVVDNGQGLPDGFSVERTRSLGLSIVRDLVTSQLGGRIQMESPPAGSASGTRVIVDVPLDTR